VAKASDAIGEDETFAFLVREMDNNREQNNEEVSQEDDD